MQLIIRFWTQISEHPHSEEHNGGYTLFKPERLYVPLGMDIAYECKDGWVFDHDIYSNPIVYTTCNPDGKMYLHGEKRNWPKCIIRKIDYLIIFRDEVDPSLRNERIPLLIILHCSIH